MRETPSSKKLSRGPGGWRCPCCSMYPVNIAKIHLARRNRRKGKQELASAAIDCE
jgi:hypothetical protein